MVIDLVDFPKVAAVCQGLGPNPRTFENNEMRW